MKYIKLLAVVALLGVFASCSEKNFEPVTGNTAVEFVNTEATVDLLGEYHYIPVQMVEQSTTAAKATVRFTGGMVEFKEGTKRDVVEFTNDEQGYQNGGDIIITSYTINVGAYDAEVDGDGLPTNSIEVMIPNYKNIKSIELNFELVGDNVGGNATTKYVAKVVSDVLIGKWSMGEIQFSITKQTGSSYSMKIPTSFGDVVFVGTKSGSQFTVEPTGSTLDLTEYGFGAACLTYFSPYDEEEGFWPGQSVVFDIDEGAETLAPTTGIMFLAKVAEGDDGYAMITAEPIPSGIVATKL